MTPQTKFFIKSFFLYTVIVMNIKLIISIAGVRTVCHGAAKI